MTYGKENPEDDRSNQKESKQDSIDKANIRIISIGASIGVVLVGLSSLVWSLSKLNLELKLKLKRGK